MLTFNREILANTPFVEAEKVLTELASRQIVITKAEIENMIENGLIPRSAYPVVVGDTALGGRGFDIPSLMFKYRNLYLHGPVTNAVCNHLNMQLHYLSIEQVAKLKDTNKRIRMYINSPGGLVEDGLTLFDYIIQAGEACYQPVETVIQSMGASMGSLLPQAATMGLRFMMPSSQMMIHGLSYGYQGKREGAARGVGSTADVMARLQHIYLERVRASKVLYEGAEPTEEEMLSIWADLAFQLSNDIFLKPSQTLKMGLADFVIFDEKSQGDWTTAVKWLHGFVTRTYNSKSERYEFTDIEFGNTPKPLEGKEREEALAFIRQLRAENIAKAEAYENKAAWERKLIEKVDELNAKEGSGRRVENLYADAAKAVTGVDVKSKADGVYVDTKAPAGGKVDIFTRPATDDKA